MDDDGFGRGLWQKRETGQTEAACWILVMDVNEAESQNSWIEKQQHSALLCMPVRNHGTDRGLGVDGDSPVKNRMARSFTLRHWGNIPLTVGLFLS